jgi:hypothetical protein
MSDPAGGGGSGNGIGHRGWSDRFFTAGFYFILGGLASFLIGLLHEVVFMIIAMLVIGVGLVLLVIAGVLYVMHREPEPACARCGRGMPEDANLCPYCGMERGRGVTARKGKKQERDGDA